MVLVDRVRNPERGGIGQVSRCVNNHSCSFRQEELNPMGGVVALSSCVSATFGWRRPHRIPVQEGYFLTWSVSLKAQTPAYAPEKKPKARGVTHAKAKGNTESRALL
jgi:hypothetical protein